MYAPMGFNLNLYPARVQLGTEAPSDALCERGVPRRRRDAHALLKGGEDSNHAAVALLSWWEAAGDETSMKSSGW